MHIIYVLNLLNFLAIYFINNLHHIHGFMFKHSDLCAFWVFTIVLLFNIVIYTILIPYLHFDISPYFVQKH